MRRFILIALVTILAIPLTVPATAATTPDYTDDRDYDDFAGRLYIDDIGIDVALYNSNAQEVVDRDDSAAYFGWLKHRIIGDHNTEAFKTLGKTKVGTTACIAKEDGTFAYYECVDIFKGHNTGKDITDWDGNSVMQKEDLLMYTCFNGPRNVWVTLWHKTMSPEEKKKQAVLNNYITTMDNLIDELMLSMENPSDSECDAEEIELIMEPYSSTQ